MTIPDAAIEAAAEALWNANQSHTWGSGRPEGMRELYVDDARAAVEAAMPAIREAIAQEIEQSDAFLWNVNGFMLAARIVRGGTP